MGLLIPALLIGGGLAVVAAASSGSSGPVKKPVAGGGGTPGGKQPDTSALNCANAHEAAKKLLGDSVYTTQIGEAVKKAQAAKNPLVLEQAAGYLDGAANLQTDAKSKQALTFLAACLRADAAKMKGVEAPKADSGTGGGIGGDLGSDIGKLACLKDKAGAVIADKGLTNLAAVNMYVPNPSATPAQLRAQAASYRLVCQNQAANELDMMANAMDGGVSTGTGSIDPTKMATNLLGGLGNTSNVGKKYGSEGF